MFYRGFTDAVGIRGGEIDVARSILLVAEMAFALEQAQHAAHSRVRWGIGKIGEHFSRVRPSPPVDDLHDLSLSASELVQSAILHRSRSVFGSISPDRKC